MSDQYETYYLEVQVFNNFNANLLSATALGSDRAKALQEAGDFQSANFVSGSTGWRLRANGNFEANSGTFRGNLVAGSIDIPNTTTANSFHVDTDGNAWWGATSLGSALAKILKNGDATFANITATGTVNATGGYIGASTALAFESTGINCGTTGHVRGGQTDYATGTGFFLGYSGAAYKFSIGGSSQFLKWDGSTLSIGGKINHLAGDVLYKSADTTRSTTNSTYTLKKQITVYRPGTYRIKFDLWTDATSADTAEGRIYKNGSAVGTERSNGSTITNYSEDISGVAAGDTLELYIKFTYNGGVASTANCRNFRLYVLDYDSATVNVD